MAITAAQLMVKVGADIGDFQRKMRQVSDGLHEVGSRFNVQGAKIRDRGKDMTKNLTLPLVAAGAAAFKFASDAEEAANKVDVIFGDAAASVHKFADSAAKNLQMTRGEAQESMGTLGALMTASGVGRNEAADMVQDLAQRAADLGSIMNTSASEAMQRFSSGLTGEMEPLKRYGIILSAARVEAEALSMGLGQTSVDMTKVRDKTLSLESAQLKAVKAVEKYGEGSLEARKALMGVEKAQVGLEKALAGGKVELTEADKMLARYNLIMKDSAFAQGDLANTADSASNQMKFLRTELKQLGEDLGRELIPVITPLIAGIRSIVKAFGALPAPAKRMILVIAGIAAAIGPLLIGIGSLVSAIGTLSMAAGAVAGVIAGLSVPILAVIAAIVAAVIGLKLAWDNNWLGLRDALQPVVDAVGKVFGYIKTIVKDFFAVLGGTMTWDEFTARAAVAWGRIHEIVSGAMQGLRDSIAQVWQHIRDAVSSALQNLLQSVGIDAGRAAEIVRNAWANLVTWAGNIWEAVVNAVKGALETLKGIIAGVVAVLGGDWEAAWQIFKDTAVGVVTTFVDTIAALMGDIGPKIAQVWQDVQAAVISAWQDIKSKVSEIASGLGENLEGAKAGLLAVWDDIKARSGQSIDSIKATIGEKWAAIAATVTDKLNGLKEAAISVWQTIKAVLTGKDEGITPIGDAAQAAEQAAAWREAVLSVQSAWSEMQAHVTTIANTLKLFIETWLTATQTAFATTWLAIQTNTANTVTMMAGAVMASITQMVAGIVGAFTTMASSVVAIVHGMAASVIAALSGLAGRAHAAGAAIGEALAAGIRSQEGAVRSAAQALAAAARVNLPGSDAQEGPLSDLTASGRALPETFAKGVLSNLAVVKDAIAKATGTALVDAKMGMEIEPIQAPEIVWPEIVWPEFRWPALPQYPAFQWPALPDIPKLELGELPPFQWPALPVFEWPIFRWPEFVWPTLPEFAGWPDLPSLLELQWPAFPALPEFELPELPEFTWPAFEWPQFSWPPFTWPELPRFTGWPELPSLLDLHWPALPALPEFSWPALPAFAWPEFQWPIFEWPALPAFDGWPALPSLEGLTWPQLPSLLDLKWPTLPEIVWPEIVWPEFQWPALPEWVWPKLPEGLADAISLDGLRLAAAPPITNGNMTGVPPAPPTAPQVDQSVHVTIYNPQGEPTEESILHQLRNLAALGVLQPIKV